MARQKKPALTPASFGKTLYRFVARNSVIVPAIVRGFRQNLKFSVSFEGSAHFSTSDGEKADAIRNSALFKSGAIREIESVPVDGTGKAPAKKTAPKTPAWMQSIQSVGGLGGAKPDNTAENANVKCEENPADGPGADGTLFDGADGQNGVQDNGSQEQNPDPGITLEEVDNYTDAVNYLRDTEGMPDDILSRDDVAAWAATNGIVFPNFQF